MISPINPYKSPLLPEGTIDYYRCQIIRHMALRQALLEGPGTVRPGLSCDFDVEMDSRAISVGVL